MASKSIQSQMEEYRVKLEKFLYKENAFTNVLAKIESTTKVKRTYVALGAIGFTVIWLIVGYAADFLCNLIGFIYPAYMSVKAIESASKDDDTQWLIYWVVYASFMLVEFFSDIFLSWFPMYFLLKCVFLLWCMAPSQRNGAQIIYNRIIRPWVLRNQSQIDRTISGLTGKATAALGEAQKVAKDAAVGIAADQLTRQVDGSGDEVKKDI